MQMTQPIENTIDTNTNPKIVKMTFFHVIGKSAQNISPKWEIVMLGYVFMNFINWNGKHVNPRNTAGISHKSQIYQPLLNK